MNIVPFGVQKRAKIEKKNRGKEMEIMKMLCMHKMSLRPCEKQANNSQSAFFSLSPSVSPCSTCWPRKSRAKLWHKIMISHSKQNIEITIEVKHIWTRTTSDNNDTTAGQHHSPSDKRQDRRRTERKKDGRMRMRPTKKKSTPVSGNQLRVWAARLDY